MGTLYLVRHGQASFGADDYDNLSPLGHQQSQRLGTYFRERGLQFEAALMGSLKRHRQTFEGIQEGLQAPQLQPLVWPGLNEYDSHAVIHTIHPAPLAKPNTPELYKHHFGLLRKGCKPGCMPRCNLPVCRFSPTLCKASKMPLPMCGRSTAAMC